MNPNHEPREEFVRRLEARVASEARSRVIAPVARLPRWLPQTPLAAAAGLAFVILISMSLGGAVVAARYQNADQQQRQLLAASYQQRLELERQKLDIAKTQLQSVQRRVAIGAESSDAGREAENDVKSAEVQMRIMMLHLDEVRATGKEPNDAVSAPVTAGRDFVRERLQARLETVTFSLDLEKSRLARAQRSFNIGLSTKSEMVAAESRVREVEQALHAAQQRLEIRQQFVNNQIDAAMADLRMLETDADLRLQTATSRMDLARRRMSEVQSNFSKGLMTRIDVAQAELRVSEVELDIKKAQLDLTLIRQQIAQKKGK